MLDGSIALSKKSLKFKCGEAPVKMGHDSNVLLVGKEASVDKAFCESCVEH